MDDITIEQYDEIVRLQPCRRAYFKKYYRNNRVARLIYQSVYQERNSMRISEYQKVYQKAYRARKKLEKLNNT
jgi:hypothetical protein